MLDLFFLDVKHSMRSDFFNERTNCLGPYKILHPKNLAPRETHGTRKDSCGFRRAKSAYDAEGDVSATALEQDVVRRILRAPDAFSVLGIHEKGPDALAEVKTAYKKLALRVQLGNDWTADSNDSSDFSMCEHA